MEERERGWDTVQEEAGVRLTPPTGNDPYVSINGQNIRLEAGANFVDTVKNISRDAGFGKFRTYLNGEEIKPSQAPSMINEGDRLEIRAYDVAGA